MSRFDTIVMVDWSGGNDRGAVPKPDAIWAGVVRNGVEEEPVYLRNRQVAEAWLAGLFREEIAAGRRVLAGFDFPFGYPQGVARAVTGKADPFALWDWLEARIEDGPQRNNRWQVADGINALFPGVGPFWGNGTRRDLEHLPRKGRDRRGHGCAEFRQVETLAKGTFTVWQLAGAGAVGSQVLMGLPVLARLRRRFDTAVTVWPFEAASGQVVLAEIWPSLIRDAVKAEGDDIRDRAQVRLLARAIAGLPEAELNAMLAIRSEEEGWILGLGHEDALNAALAPTLHPPALKDDCFALPPGVDWTPVPEALARLRDILHPVVGTETVPLHAASGRVLAEDTRALRANPPNPNAAVDGYGFAHAATGDGPQVLPLVRGRAAAGLRYDGTVPTGHAIRILTGAALPEGVDTVVLEEDCRGDARHVAFNGPVKPGANTRKAGEDVAEGDVMLPAGHRLRAPDLALLAATGHGAVPVHRRLKVAVISTGDELREAGDSANAGQIYDANRPMLTAILRGWGHQVIDLGRQPDDAGAIREALNKGAKADAVLTSGGASAGDEDHISRLLREEGRLSNWRIALKPGRPLALAQWRGVPVFGLPGNPVAALVCTLIFARPALSLLSGAGWQEPLRMQVPAGFAKSKKHGRAEYPRARIGADGRVELFKSEGSGRISGLSWAGGLLELPYEAQEIAPGDPVTFLPYAGFGL
ncbi:molybdopterin-binding protein [Alterinioella nitratireducens]|uniref:molybdopterin-binding protein n=1 Tax=Alterinioella nitratireducens TaxID=2735915 RepID=UPI00405930E4